MVARILRCPLLKTPPPDVQVYFGYTAFGSAAAAAAKSLQSYPALCDPMDCSLPGSSVHGIFQTRVLEWGAIAFSDVVSEIYFY